MIRNLSYVGITSPAADEWRSFGVEVLGAQLASDGPDGAVRLRVDDAPWRIAVHPGDHDDVAYFGWEVAALGDLLERAEGAGLAVERTAVGNAAHAPGERPAAVAASFVDPFGFHHELVTELVPGERFEPGRPISGFVTGEQGLGHVVLLVPDLDAASDFYTDVFGFRPTDRIEGPLSVRFLHCPGHAARHHTLALASVPGMVGLHHLMVEVGSIDDVGRAYDIVRARDMPLAMDFGRHANDLMTSFYVRTPSGFELEYGTGGLVVDDDTWQVDTFDTQSIWGHHLPASGMLMPGILRAVTDEEVSA